MTIHRDTCRMHKSKVGQKRITFNSKFGDLLDLPLKVKLLVEYDDAENVLTIKEWN